MVSLSVLFSVTLIMAVTAFTQLDNPIIPRQDSESLDSTSTSSRTRKTTRTTSPYPTAISTSTTRTTLLPYTFTSTFPSSTAASTGSSALATPTSGGSKVSFDGIMLGCVVVGGLVLAA
ncbi:hypothetical protein ONS95_006530 [Cadophora gregata]|uniref:uncharacterized protein n=1 Tax=Cadophora gregata TaxID=51156 RepID=UPI0026DD4FF4|nr:uncharacterized protein ONS95_006530 [Cadophora gregata]KAK0101355.1 hypothetical protein ONS95_006530 [Cadophora gregata]KAK0106635.1 hypothetical protein ONS96_004256 [Cadophora gregata f. sp. sojae]